MPANDREKLIFPIFIVSFVVLVVNVYWFAFPLFFRMGLAHPSVTAVLQMFERAGFFSSPLKLKLVCVLCVFMTTYSRPGKRTEMPWLMVIAFLVASLALFLVPVKNNAEMYAILSVIGYAALLFSTSVLSRKMRKGASPADNDSLETFDQMTRKITTAESINFRTEFKYKGRLRKGWLNVVNVFRGNIVLGTPGSGKSYSFFYGFIEQMIQKKFTMFVYDFKMPDLTDIVYNEYLNKYPDHTIKDPDNPNRTIHNPKTPKFCVINFKDLRQSMRCNPLNARYLTDMSDAHEVADLIMKNVNPNAIETEDFFVASAKVYIAALVWLLKKYKKGIYCSFPHLIELMGQNYEAVFEIMKQDPELMIMVTPFADAMNDNAQEQLQGQIASARIPLLRFPSPSLYWVLTGDDFTLDLNNPDDPKILCVGNDPDRQATYGASLALIVSRLVKVLNHKTNQAGKRNRPCGFLLDEFPTVFIKGIDNLIATARSNKVAVILGAQDKTQIVRDYKRENADVVFNTIGNIFSGQVNGETAKRMSEMFGREYRLQESSSTSASGDTSVSSSYRQDELLPQSRIETLSNGYFFGKVADDQGAVQEKKFLGIKYKSRGIILEKKLFCGKILVNAKEREKKEQKWEKIPDFGAQKYFDFRPIREKVHEHEESEIKNYLKDVVMKAEQSTGIFGRNVNPASNYVIIAEVQARYDVLTDEEKAKILLEVERKREDEYIQKIIDDNYQKIKDDIAEMFSTFGIDLEKFEKGNDGEDDAPQTAPSPRVAREDDPL